MKYATGGTVVTWRAELKIDIIAGTANNIFAPFFGSIAIGGQDMVIRGYHNHFAVQRINCTNQVFFFSFCAHIPPED
jgi:hypothetical protein